MGTCLSFRKDEAVKIADLEQILFNMVKLEHLTAAQAMCVGNSIYLEVGWNYVDFHHKLTKFHRPKDKTAEEYRNVTLFRTKFVNRSPEPQQYTFRTERQTTSSCSLEVQRGFTLGAETNLEFALPTAAAPGVEPSKISGGLSGQLSWSKTRGETKEETLIWSVDSQVKVQGGKVGYAALVVHEENFDAELKLETTLKSRLQSHCIPVMVKRSKDKTLLFTIEIPMADIAIIDPATDEKRCENFDYDATDRSLKVTTEGTCKAVYGVEQVIQIETRDLVDSDALSSSLMELNIDSNTIRQGAAANSTKSDDVTKDVATEKTPLKSVTS